MVVHVHIPSFLVGTAVTGTGFLMLHKEMSHRERLSPKWRLREVVEDQVQKIIASAKSKAVASDYDSNNSSSNSSDSAGVGKGWMGMDLKKEGLKLEWNKGLETVRGFLQDNVFSSSSSDAHNNENKGDGNDTAGKSS